MRVPDQRVSTPPMLRRGLNRMESATYVGFSATKFDEMVGDGRMPKPKRVDRRKIWDLRDLDASFENLPYEDTTNPWDTIS